MAYVLVLDDELAVRNTLVRTLQKHGHDAAGEGTIENAVNHARTHRVDILLTDMFMPGHDGFEAIEAFRRQFADVRIIAMSGGGAFGMQDVLEIARCLGVATLTKPVTPERLIAAIDGLLGNLTAVQAKTFLPAELATPDDVAAMHARVMATANLTATLDASPGLVLLLNQQRQTVFANRAALTRLGYRHLRDAIGLRPGRLFGCAHAGDTACGTTEFCRYCGSAQVLAGALRARATEKECRITSVEAGHELDLRIAARPFPVGDDPLIMLSFTDIANEKRREALEAMFFHDVLNTAGGIRGLTQIIPVSPPNELPKMQRALETLSQTLVDEIKMQRDLTMAERGELAVSLSALDAHAVLETVASHYRTHPVAAGREIVVEPTVEELRLNADPTILGRVLGNMVKNALEAVAEGATVRLSAVSVGASVQFTVENPGRMPESAQKQVFQRSFSTKGGARGLGTYGMRLLTERYMGGRVWFESDQATGTRFHVEIPAGVRAALV